MGMIHLDWRRWLGAWLAALVASYIPASVAQSCFTLLALRRAGAVLTPDHWLRTIGHDLWGFAFSAHLVPYPLLLGLALAAGFVVATGLAGRLARGSPPVRPGYWLYPLAGALAVAVMLALVHRLFFGAHFFSATRTFAGQASQVAAGAIGGGVFAWLWSGTTAGRGNDH